MDDPSELICRLVEKVSGRSVVTPRMRLWHDLRLGGDDVIELLERIHMRFGTSFSDFSCNRFFPEETEAMGAHLAATLGFHGKWQAVTVQHLADVAVRGSWFDPPVA